MTNATKTPTATTRTSPAARSHTATTSRIAAWIEEHYPHLGTPAWAAYHKVTDLKWSLKLARRKSAETAAELERFRASRDKTSWMWDASDKKSEPVFVAGHVQRYYESRAKRAATRVVTLEAQLVEAETAVWEMRGEKEMWRTKRALHAAASRKVEARRRAYEARVKRDHEIYAAWARRHAAAA